jgi:hypothetical protein
MWTNSMEEKPSWEANSRSASQEIPRLLWSQKVNYRVYNSPSLEPILHTVTPYEELFLHIKLINMATVRIYDVMSNN